MANAIVFLYYVVLLVGFFALSYGSAWRKRRVELVGNVLTITGIISYFCIMKTIDNADSAFVLPLQITYLILLFPVRFNLERKWRQDYERKRFMEDYANLKEEFLRESELFKNAVDVKKFALSSYIKGLREYAWYLENLNVAIERWDGLAKNPEKETTDALYVARKCMETVTETLFRLRGQLIMERSEEITKDAMKCLGQILFICAYPDKDENKAYDELINKERLKNEPV